MSPVPGGPGLELIGSPYGIIISIGVLLPLIGFLIGLGGNFPTAIRLNALSKKLDSSNEQPTSENLREIQRLQNKSFMTSKIIAVLLFTSLIAMS